MLMAGILCQWCMTPMKSVEAVLASSAPSLHSMSTALCQDCMGGGCMGGGGGGGGGGSHISLSMKP